MMPVDWGGVGAVACVDVDIGAGVVIESTARDLHAHRTHLTRIVIDYANVHTAGILTSEKRARDIKISAFSLSLHGIILVEDTGA